GLAGALLGIGLAALIETFRPTIVGARAIGEELGTPPIGELAKPGEDVPGSLAEKARFAAITAEAKFIQLIASDPDRDLSRLAKAMQLALKRALGGGRMRISPAPPKFRSFSASPTRVAEGRSTALIAVLPSSIAKSDLEP